MLQGFRKAGQSWLGKIVVAVMFGFLIVSFAIWGVNDIFRGSPRSTVASVGRTDISAEAVRQAYQNELQRLSRQTRRAITPDQARAFGLDRQVLAKLVTEATLDQKVADLGVRIPDRAVAKSITEDPTFKGPNGAFDRATFDEVLRNAGLSEPLFVREQRATQGRLQVVEAATADLPVPLAAREAIHRYGAERRAAAFLTLDAAAAGEIPAPDDAALSTYYDEHKAAFRAAETRGFTYLALDPVALAKPDAVTDDEARARYAATKDRYGQPERRTIQEITFLNAAEAEAAFARVKEAEANGTANGAATFEAIGAEHGLDAKGLELGTFARSELVDPAVAEAAFALADGAVSGPVQGRFGTVLLRVAGIEPESAKPFEAVAGEVRRDAAVERARARLETVHDAIEDQRASARPLADIAREQGLTLGTVAAADRGGKDPSGKPVEGLPDRDGLVAAVFRSDLGVDNEPLHLRDGTYVWFDVTKVDPARDRPLAEVRDAVVAGWRADETARRLADRARGLVERLDKGEAIEALATEAGAKAGSATGLARGEAKDGLSADVVNRIFAVPVGKAGSTPSGGAEGAGRVVFKVTSATVPPFITSTQAAGEIEAQVRVAVADDVLAEYLGEIQKGAGVRVNEDALRRAVGGEF